MYYILMICGERYLECIECGGELKRVRGGYQCIKCQCLVKVEKGIINCLKKEEGEKLFSRRKWDEFYNNRYRSESYWKDYVKEKDNYIKYGVNQIKKYYNLSKDSVYLEIGCGSFIMGSLLSKEVKMVIGIDFSLPGLVAAKKLFKKLKIKNYLLIRGDIFNIPLKDKTIDLLYGGGVIEHFKDTEGCVKEYSRVMKNGGVALNAVPYLNIGSLTYRQLWGNIPDFPVIKQMAELIHIKILKGKHMYFGYELSFTKNKIRYLHFKYGFNRIKFVRMETEVMFGFLPNFIKPFFRYLAVNCSWFWPMMLVVAEK